MLQILAEQDHGLQNTIILHTIWTTIDLENQELSITIVGEKMNKVSKEEVTKVLKNVITHGCEWSAMFRKVIASII